MNIRVLACELAEAVEAFRAKARRFFYRVVLIGRRCPACNGSPEIVSEGRCRCVACARPFDPTVTFQRCPVCGGVPVLRIRRYQCRDCGADIRSKFLFEGVVFNADYFRQKMAESRQHKHEQRDRVRQMLAETRSGRWAPEQVSLDSVPDLAEALNAFVGETDDRTLMKARKGFDLKRYENHVLGHLREWPVSLAGMASLGSDARMDLIWRFVAIVFLAHAGVVDVWQDGRDIMVKRHEANGERQDILGESEGIDRVEGLVG